jgi:OOP family OmpA-OmpF porin
MVVKFGFDKWHLDDRAETSLLEVVRQLQENPDVIVNIEGYTDGTGPAVYNVELSRRRAEAVRRFIVEKGIELHRVQTIGLGQARPAASNSTRQGRDQNRRVAVKLVMPAD